MPAPDGGDDFVGIGGPSEGLRLVVVFFEEAVDGGLEVDDRAEHTAFQPPFGEFAKNPLTALSHEQDVGVKWKVKRSWRESHWRTFGCLWAA